MHRLTRPGLALAASAIIESFGARTDALRETLIGSVEGTILPNTNGQLYQALRPLLSDFVLSMPRGAAVEADAILVLG